MVSRSPDPMAELQNAFNVLFKNWVLAVPPALVSLLGGLFFIFVVGAMIASALGASYMAGYAPPGQEPAATKGIIGLLAAGGLTMIVGIIVIGLLSLLAQAVVMGGAERVWHGEPADLGHGVGKGLSKLPPLVLLFIIAGIVFLICAVIIIIGWIAAIVLAFLFMYTVPAIVVGNEGVMQALGTSYRLVTKNFGPSALAFLGIVVVSIVGAVINRIFLGIHVLGPVLGLVVTLVVGGLTSAYAALVLVRFYDLLRGAATAVTPGPTA
jgi:hypothetical protein